MRFTLLLALAVLSGLAQKPEVLLPANYWPVFENDTVRVLHVRYGAHEKLPAHDHSDHPSVYVYLTDSGPVRFSHVEEKAFTVTRQPLKAGTFRVSPGRSERHEVENLGDIATEFLRIELKRIPLGSAGIKAERIGTVDLQPGIRSLTSSAGITVSRMVVADGSVSTTEGTVPSLFISLRNDSTINGSALKSDDVRWVEGNRKARLTGHLLKIDFNSHG